MNILIAGDFCPLDVVEQSFRRRDYELILGEVSPIINNTDYSIVNLECPVCYGGEKPINKCGPNLSCSENGVEAIKWVGFKCVTLANNHFLDFGKEGVENTMNACAKLGVDKVGGGRNIQEASQILYKTINGKKIAIINCCEHEFSIATEATAGCNPLNPIQQYYSIKDAKQEAEYVLVIVHGGHEHYQLPSIRMQETYRFFIDAGADAVVNHHQHCYSGYEVYKEKPIFYGLGNFCFSKSGKIDDIWNYGYMVKIYFETNVTFDIFPYKQCSKEPSIRMLDKKDFNNKLGTLCGIINNPIRLKREVDNYYHDCEKSIENLLEPLLVFKLFSSLRRRKLAPSLVTKRWLIKLFNFVICESHRDKMQYYLEKKIKENA